MHMQVLCPHCRKAPLSPREETLACTDESCSFFVPAEIESLDESAPADEETGRLWAQRGTVFTQLEVPQAALAALSNAIATFERCRSKDSSFLSEGWAEALVARADLQEQMGDTAGFVVDLQSAVAVYTAMRKAGRSIDAMQYIHALHRCSLGQERRHDFDSAWRNLTELLAFADEREGAGEPVDSRLVAEAALSRAFVGTALKRDTVLPDFNRAVTLLEGLRESGKPYDANRLAVAHLNFGISLYRANPKGDPAFQRLGKAVEVWQELSDKGEQYDRNGHAIAFMYMGLVKLAGHDLDGTVAWFSKALEQWDAMVAADEPIDIMSYGSALIDRGVAYYSLGQYGEAKTDLLRARDILTQAAQDGLGAFDRPLAKIAEWLEAIAKEES